MAGCSTRPLAGSNFEPRLSGVLNDVDTSSRDYVSGEASAVLHSLTGMEDFQWRKGTRDRQVTTGYLGGASCRERIPGLS